MMRMPVSRGQLEYAREDVVLNLGPDIVGIDLGTSNSCACMVLNGEPTIIEVQDPDGIGVAPTFPSVVSYGDDNRTLVGKAAVSRMDTDPRRTVFGAKRFIGREYDSPQVREMLSRFPYRIVRGGLGQVAVDINGKAVNLTSISARILQQLRRAVSHKTGRNISRAIITVPAFYNDNQRQAVVVAGKLAGLQVERVINEPTAAAIAYGLHSARPRKFIVYDLGGGTFDVSVMSTRPDALVVRATAGDTFLGGEDFDNAIADWVATQFYESSGMMLSNNATARARVKRAAELAKRRLSTHHKAMVVVRDALTADGQTVRIETELDRVTVAALVHPLILRTIKITDMTLQEAGFKRSDIEDVILVGGQTRMPAVYEAVKHYFGRAPRVDIDPDQVVAMGAGMLAGMPANAGQQFRDVLPMTIGLAQGQKFRPILPKNTQVPARKQIVLKVPEDRFRGFTLRLYQGESPQLHRNEFLGEVKLDSVNSGGVNPVPMQVDLSLSEDCLLNVSLTNQATRESVQVLLNATAV